MKKKLPLLINRKILSLIFTILILVNLTTIFPYQTAYAAGNVLYAIPDGLTSGFCNRWETACTLQIALANAMHGDEIWVASGTHKPTTGTDQFVSFAIKNGVSIYGGFSGSETQRNQRNPAVNLTILSGDIGTIGDASDNSLNVTTGSGIDSSTILDGFTISSGNAFLSNPPYNGGGGMNLINSSPSINNVKFLSNYGTYGGGMYTNNSSPVLSMLYSRRTLHLRQAQFTTKTTAILLLMIPLSTKIFHIPVKGLYPIVTAHRIFRIRYLSIMVLLGGQVGFSTIIAKQI